MSGKLNLKLPSPIQPLSDKVFDEAGIQVLTKRDDLIDEEISGNKWRKLKYNINESGGFPILTFGGAFSNHIAATAAACYRLGVKSIGVIRGERTSVLNNTLQRAEEYGMHLHFISRSDYRFKNQPEFVESLQMRFGNFYSVPEGGSNTLGVKGSGEIITEINRPFDYLISAMGTGTTLTGMLIASEKHQQHLGIPVLKNGGFLKDEVDLMVKEYCRFYNQPEPKAKFGVYADYHHGGYARISDELIAFMRYFYKQHGIKTDPVYSGKSAFALYDLTKKGHFKKGSTIIWLHCGGLQGIEGIEKRYRFKLY